MGPPDGFHQAPPQARVRPLCVLLSIRQAVSAAALRLDGWAGFLPRRGATNSGMPPALVAPTGVPHACASSTERPNGSQSDALTITSMDLRISGTSARAPVKQTRVPSAAVASFCRCPALARRVVVGAPTTTRLTVRPEVLSRRTASTRTEIKPPYGLRRNNQE